MTYRLAYALLTATFLAPSARADYPDRNLPGDAPVISGLIQKHDGE